jgi:hypothetical protein
LDAYCKYLRERQAEHPLRIVDQITVVRSSLTEEQEKSGR